MSQHRGRGHPAFQDGEIKDFLRDVDVAKTSELQDEFDVSDTAIRNRLKEMEGVGSRKIRNRRIWYVPHETTPEPDGSGYIGGFPVGALTPLAKKLAWVSVIMSIVLAIGNIVFNIPLVFAVIALILSALFTHTALRYEDRSDPSIELKDVENSLQEGK